MSASATEEATNAPTSASENAHAWIVKRWPVLLICFIISVFVFGIAITSLSKSTPTNRAGIARIQHSESAGPLRVSGTTEAVRLRAIVAPMLEGQQFGTLTITKLTPSGTHVRKGDILVDFDKQSQMRDLIDKQDEYQKLVSQVAQEQAKEDSARAKDETELQQAESDLSKAQLELQRRELMSRIDAEKAQQAQEGAQATLQQLRATFELKRKSSHSAVRLLEIQRDRARQVMEHARANTELMQIKSPIDGVVVLSSIWKQNKMGQVQEGDQVRTGISFMQVVDPSAMQVRALVNQEDFLSLHFGDTATIHFDAYPDLAFPGKLIEMAPIGRSGDFSSRLRSFAVIFSIEGADPKLMPDLSAAVDVKISAQVASARAAQ